MLSAGGSAAEAPAQGLDTSPSGAASAAPNAPPITYIFLNREEAAFIESAVARLIPADATWPGALEAGVPNYIDKQRAGVWGTGERLYRSGPWRPGPGFASDHRQTESQPQNSRQRTRGLDHRARVD